MDPNALLARILELCEGHTDYGWIAPDEADELAESIKEMHRWVMSGGFLPAVWADKLSHSAPVIHSDDPFINPSVVGTPPF